MVEWTRYNAHYSNILYTDIPSIHIVTNVGWGSWCKCPTLLTEQPTIDQYSLIKQSYFITLLYSSQIFMCTVHIMNSYVATNVIVCDNFLGPSCTACIHHTVIVCPLCPSKHFLLDMPMSLILYSAKFWWGKLWRINVILQYLSKPNSVKVFDLVVSKHFYVATYWDGAAELLQPINLLVRLIEHSVILVPTIQLV